MKKKFIKTPLKGVYVHGAKDVGTRTVNLLMGEHAGEYVRGDIMDANAVIQAFDEFKGNVDNNHDSLEEVVDELHNLRDATDQSFETFQEKAEEETANRIQGDKTLDQKIDQKERESKERDNVLQQNIDTEKQERVNADTQLRNDLNTEINRAKAKENALASDIQAEATKRENDDNTIKDNLNAEVTRATAKENEIKAEVDVINGDSTTEGSFRKAIADVVGAAPEAYDTLKEIADKLNENDDLHAAINDAIATKATTVALNEEITRAKAAEAENKAEIAAEAARAKKVEGDNALAIQNEASRATTAETAINEAVNTEVERAKGQEAYLQSLINTKADTTALEGAKTELDKKISDETTRATGVEATKANADDLTAEITRAKQAEAAITSDVTEKLAQKADNNTLANYVLKTELPIVPTKTSQLTNDSNFITSADVDLTPYATTEALTAVDQRVTANTTAIANINKSNGIPYDPSVTSLYQTDKNLAIKVDDANTASFGPNSCISLKSGDANIMAINYGGMSLKSDDYTFSVNPGGIKQVGSYKFDVNMGDGIKWSTTDGVVYSKIDAAGLESKMHDNGYTKCNNSNFIDIKNASDHYVTLTPENLLMKSGGSQITLTPEQLLIQKGGSNLMDVNPNGATFIIKVANTDYGKLSFYNYSGNVYLKVESLSDNIYTNITQNSVYFNNGFGLTNNGIYTNINTVNPICVYDKEEGTFYGKFVTLDTSLGHNVNLIDSINEVKRGISSKQDKITPTTELDLTSIDTADIESLRLIVKSLATELNTLGLIKLKSAVETA